MAGKGNGKNGASKRRARPQSEYQRGFLAGYDQGLSECSPLAGVTRYFERGRKRGKIAAGSAEARQEAAAEAARRHGVRSAAERKLGMAAVQALNPETTTDFGAVLAVADQEGGFSNEVAYPGATKALLRAKLIKKAGRYRDQFEGTVQVYKTTAKGKRALHEQYPEAIEAVYEDDPGVRRLAARQVASREMVDNPVHRLVVTAPTETTAKAKGRRFGRILGVKHVGGDQWHVMVAQKNPDRPLTKAEVKSIVKRGKKKGAKKNPDARSILRRAMRGT